MRIAGMTALAEHRDAHRQEMGVVRAVRGVTAQAVVANRAMLPEKRAAFLIVTGKAERVDTRRAKQVVPAGRMNVMALAALHPRASAIIGQDMRGTLQLGASYGRVTSVARL